MDNAQAVRQTSASRSNTLIDVAKRLQRSQTQAMKLRRELKAVLLNIKHDKRMLKSLAMQISHGE